MAEKKKERELYRLTYVIDGVQCFVEMVPKGARLTGLFRPSMPHSTFDGWGEVPARMPACDLTIEGHFTKEIYRVIFAAGVEQYGVAEMPAGRPLTPPPAPRHEGLEFVEWEGFEGVMPAENRVFEARFKPLTYTVTYVIDDTYRFRVRCPFGAAFPRVTEPKRANHVFSGWSEMPETMPASDVTIAGHFEEKKYKLTRVVDDVIFSEEYLPFGAEIDKKVKPQQDGYYFSGWRKLPDTMPARDVEVVASMYPARYRVDFLLNGEEYHSVYVPFGEPIPVVTVPDERGKLFGGWDNLPPTMPAHDVVIRGKTTAIQYKLSFEVDGKEIDRRDLAEGEDIPTDVAVPSKPGFAFCGWENAPEEMPGHDLTLRAVYAAVRTRYVFMIDYEVYAEIAPENGAEIEFPKPPPKDGKVFGGWEEPELDPRTGVTTYYGSYDSSASTYTVSYVVAGDVIETQELRPGAVVMPPKVEESEAYTFLGWTNLPEFMPSRNLIIKAKTKRLKYTLSFMVDGEVIYEMTLDAGAEIACPAPAPREGHTFGGWQDVPAVMPEDDLIIYGSYRTRTHTVTYKMAGEVIDTAEVRYGEELTPPDVPERTEDGRNFVGWFPEITVMPDEDVVIEGAYSDTICLIDIYVDGIRKETIRARVGESPRLPTYPAREGMHFVWQDAPSLVPEGQLDVHGGYVKNTHTVTYLLGDVVIGEERYSYGSALNPQVNAPESAAGAFLGWKDLPSVMPDQDISVQAAFADRTCHLTFRLDGRVFTEMDVPVGAPTPNPEVPEREGYRFDGWRNYVSIMPPYNFTAYGTYSRRTYRITYLVGDEVLEEQDYVSGAPITAPVPPEREHATFRTWEGLGTNMPAEDMTVSARYCGETYRISYVVDGALLHTAELEFGEKIEPLSPTPREGVAFTGWKNLPAFMPAREVIVTGAFEKSTYTVTYKIGEMIYRIDTYEAGDAITPPEAPEQDHADFVRWKNLATVMPDYDFTCVAEYNEVVSRYSFVLDGEILTEGQSRKGEMLTPPDAPHRSGFAFAGWEGFTGIMPAEDVVYIGSYVTDKFKVQYFIDDEFYCESGFDEGERVVPADPPEKEGYEFSGWKNLPHVMPSDDVEVRGYMKPNLYRLIYRTDGKDIVFDKEVPCGTPLGKIEAPERFGFEFSGWNEEPAIMPAHPLTVNGVYRFSEEQFITVNLPDDARISERANVHKSHPKEPLSLVFISGDYIRAVVEGICYPIPVPADKVCLRNGRVVDETGLAHALRRVWRKYRLPKKVSIVMADTHTPDLFYETTDVKEVPNDEAMAVLWKDDAKYGKAEYRAQKLSHTTEFARMLISRTRADNNEALTRVFKVIGVTVTSVRTMAGALVEYLQPNKRMERKKNQMCLFYLPNGLTGVLMLDGQVVSIVQNRYPFEGRNWDVKGYTERVIEMLTEEAHRNLATTPLSMIAVGGIDRTHVRVAEKSVAKMAKAAVEKVIGDSVGGLFGGLRRWHRPAVHHLGFAHTENRTK